MNNLRKKRFSISAGSKDAGLFPVAEKTTSPLLKSMYHTFTSDSAPWSAQNDVREKSLSPSDLEGLSGRRSRIRDFISSRLGWREPSSRTDKPLKPNATKLRSGDFPSFDIVRQSRNIMELVCGSGSEPRSPVKSCSRDDSLSLMQATFSEARYSDNSLTAPQSPISTTTYVTANVPSTKSSVFPRAKNAHLATGTLPEVTLNVPTLEKAKRQSSVTLGWEIPITDLRQCWRTSRLREMAVPHIEWYESENTGTGCFMLLQLTFPPELRTRDIWMRLERRSANSRLRSNKEQLRLLVGESLEGDIAILSSDKNSLLGGEIAGFRLTETVDRLIPFSHILDVLDLAHTSSHCAPETLKSSGREFR
ncbi:hypothetical protein FRC12_006869 [Ceratobasidium sp. 428]|nr:hypothetical protein FRC12_006869 [Ceratobasidium sp. 428]